MNLCMLEVAAAAAAAVSIPSVQTDNYSTEKDIYPSFNQNVAIHGDADEPPFPCIPLMQGGKRPWVKISRTRWCRE